MGITIEGCEKQRASIRRCTIFVTVLILRTVVNLLGPDSVLPASLSATNRAAPETAPPCDQFGWFPEDFGLKDHTVFWHDGLYYIASIYLADEGHEEQFAYGTSPDLCQWTDLGGILHERQAGEWDEFRKRLYIPIPSKRPAGPVTLRVEISDRAGNSSVDEYGFVIQ